MEKYYYQPFILIWWQVDSPLSGSPAAINTFESGCIKVAKEVGVDVPRMETLYALLKALDEAMALRSPGKSLGGDETEEARRARAAA
jgi:hypothetical protein